MANGTQLQEVVLSEIEEDENNPRGKESFGDLKGLAQSIREVGILEPMIVRPIPGQKGLQLVAGHRRLRAAKMAGLEKAQVLVRTDMDNVEALTAQLVENAQREGISAMDEAEAYERLHKELGQPVEQIAKQVGKSPETVWAMLKLTNLVPPAREALREGKLSPSSALLVARVPKGLQAAATKALVENVSRDEDTGEPVPKSVRYASQIIRHGFMVELKRAPFPLADAELDPKAGSCTACPHRTGNMDKALTADVGSPNVCTNPPCYKGKSEKAWAKTKEAVKKTEAADQTDILEGAAAAKHFGSSARPGELRELAYNTTYVDVLGVCLEDPKNRTWGELLKRAGGSIGITIARDPDGRARTLVSRSQAVAVLKNSGIGAKWLGAPRGERNADVDRYKAERRKKKDAEALDAEAIAQALRAIEKKLPKLALPKELAVAVAHEMFYSLEGEGGVGDAGLALFFNADDDAIDAVMDNHPNRMLVLASAAAVIGCNSNAGQGPEGRDSFLRRYGFTWAKAKTAATKTRAAAAAKAEVNKKEAERLTKRMNKMKLSSSEVAEIKKALPYLRQGIAVPQERANKAKKGKKGK